MYRFEPHSHTMGSNIRLLDSINKPEDLIQRAIDIGLKGLAITDHEFLGMIPRSFEYIESIQEKYPDFKLAAGDEIYLCPNRENGQKYFHFILIAKNKIGWRALRELSSRAWLNSYYDRGMERVVTTYDDLEEIMQKYPDSLIATSACLGGELSVNTLNLCECEKIGDTEGATAAHNNIVNFLLFCKKIFKNDFYIECAPGCSKEQIIVNQRLVSIAKAFDIKMVIGSDAHYLSKEDRYVHESYLNSKGGEREVASFYEYAYLQTEEEIIKHLEESIPNEIEKMFNNSMEIYDKIERYSIWHNQTIPKVEVKDYPKFEDRSLNKYPILHSMKISNDKYERYWINECLIKLKELEKDNDTYLSRLEEEANTKKVIGEKLGTNIFAYPITLQHYIDMFWESGSIVGAGRGSSCSGLNHYLLGVTQLDPIEWELPWYRYLNTERLELP